MQSNKKAKMKVYLSSAVLPAKKCNDKCFIWGCVFQGGQQGVTSSRKDFKVTTNA